MARPEIGMQTGCKTAANDTVLSPVPPGAQTRAPSGAAGVHPRFDAGRAAAELVRFGPPAYVADLDGTIIYINARYRELLAGTGDDVADNASFPPLFPIDEAVTRIIAGETEVRGREVLETGPVVQVFHAAHFPIRDRRGRVQAVGGIYEDATADTSDWHELQRTRERFDDISRLTCDIIWETDTEFRLTYISSRATEILGRHPRELMGTSLLEIESASNGAKLFSVEARSPFRDRLLSVTDRNGEMHQLRLSGVPMFTEAGTFVGYRGTCTDVSAEAKALASADQSRDRLSTAIENISEGFALYDSKNLLVLCNSRFREYLAGAHRVMFPGAPFHGLLQALSERGMIRAPDDALRTWMGLRKEAEATGEASMEVCLETGRWLRITDRPTEDGGIASIVSDITEAKGREETLRAARDLAEQGSRSKSEFLANMSHELRTPLNAIIGFSEVMRAETLGPLGSPRYAEYIDDIIDSSKHLLGVINDILDVAKSEAGKLELKEQRVSLSREIHIAQRLFAEQAAAAEVTVVIDVDEELPLLWADQRKVRQVLLNLVSNAVKFTPPGGRVTVGARVSPDGAMDLSVVDTGIGISRKDIEAAFEPFGQVESSLSRRYAGTGLGLPLARALIECHDGVMTLESEPGTGTRVTAHFPRARVLE